MIFFTLSECFFLRLAQENADFNLNSVLCWEQCPSKGTATSISTHNGVQMSMISNNNSIRCERVHVESSIFGNSNDTSVAYEVFLCGIVFQVILLMQQN